MVTYKFVPSIIANDSVQSAAYKPLKLNEELQAYIENNWTEDFDPKKSEIKFNYFIWDKVAQTVDKIKSFSLKCIDFNFLKQNQDSNGARCIYVTGIAVHIQGRNMKPNRAKEYPIELLYMRDIVMNLINSNPTALHQSHGINTMEMTGAYGAIEELELPNTGLKNYYGLNMTLYCYQHMARVTLA